MFVGDLEGLDTASLYAMQLSTGALAPEIPQGATLVCREPVQPLRAGAVVLAETASGDYVLRKMNVQGELSDGAGRSTRLNDETKIVAEVVLWQMSARVDVRPG